MEVKRSFVSSLTDIVVYFDIVIMLTIIIILFIFVGLVGDHTLEAGYRSLVASKLISKECGDIKHY